MKATLPPFAACWAVGVAAATGIGAFAAAAAFGYVGFTQATDILISGCILGFGLVGWAIGGWTAFRLDLDLVDLAKLTKAIDRPLGDIHLQRAASISASRIGLLITDACREGSPLQMLADRVLASEKDFRRVANADLGRWVDETVATEGNNLVFFQRLVLNLGILGTFCGLIQALWELQNGAGDKASVGFAEGLFAGLHLAFGTSIAGLLISTSLGLVLLALNGLRSRYSRDAEICLEKLAALCQYLEVSAVHIEAYSDLRQKLSNLNQQISLQANQVEQQHQTVSSGLTTLRSLGIQFTQFCGSLHESQKAALVDAQKMFEAFSLEQMTSALDSRIASAAGKITETVEHQLDLHLSALEASRNSIEEEGREQGRLLQQQTRQLSESSAALVEAHRKIAAVTTDLNRQLEAVRRAQVEGFFQNLDTKMATVARNSGELNELVRESVKNQRKSIFRRIFN